MVSTRDESKTPLLASSQKRKRKSSSANTKKDSPKASDRSEKKGDKKAVSAKIRKSKKQSDPEATPATAQASTNKKQSELNAKTKSSNTLHPTTKHGDNKNNADNSCTINVGTTEDKLPPGCGEWDGSDAYYGRKPWSKFLFIMGVIGQLSAAIFCAFIWAAPAPTSVDIGVKHFCWMTATLAAFGLWILLRRFDVYLGLYYSFGCSAICLLSAIHWLRQVIPCCGKGAVVPYAKWFRIDLIAVFFANLISLFAIMRLRIDHNVNIRRFFLAHYGDEGIMTNNAAISGGAMSGTNRLSGAVVEKEISGDRKQLDDAARREDPIEDLFDGRNVSGRSHSGPKKRGKENCYGDETHTKILRGEDVV